MWKRYRTVLANVEATTAIQRTSAISERNTLRSRIIHCLV
jgi:hypothetical protein